MKRKKSKKKELIVVKKDKYKQTKFLVLQALEEGSWFKDACLMAGISEETGHRWKRRDNSFDSQVELSILKYKRNLIKCVNIGALKDAKIALEVLRVRWGDEWNIPKKLEHKGSIELDISNKELAENIRKIITQDDKPKEDTGNTRADKKQIQE